MIRSRISTALVLMITLFALFWFVTNIDERSMDFGGPLVAKANSPAVTLDFSTFLGSSGSTGFAELWESVYDSSGNIVVVGVGQIRASGYPPGKVTEIGPVDNNRNIVIAKLSADGSDLLWVTLLGGSGTEKEGNGIAIDSSDNIYISGTTHSTDFPTTPGAFDRTFNGGGRSEAIVAKVSPNGKTLFYSTFLGGSGGEESSRGGITVDDQGHVYVVGITKSRDFLENASSGRPANKVNSYIGGAGDGFVVKVSQDGSGIEYMRYIGSPNDPIHGDGVLGIQVDQQKNAYIHAGLRGAGAIVTPDAYDKTFDGPESDSYFAKISPDGTNILYATYFGGSGNEFAEHRIALDSSNNAYLVGFTGSSDFPVIDGHQPTPGGNGDAYLIKFGPDGQPLFSTYIGGSAEESIYGPMVDSQGNVYVAGYTKSTDFETTPDAYDPSYNGVQDVYLQKYDSNGQLVYSTYFGGSGFDRPRFVAPDAQGNPIVVGYTESANFPTTNGAFDQAHRGGTDIFVARFVSAPPSAPINNARLSGPTTVMTGTTYVFSASVDPIIATLPLTFVWQATDQAAITHPSMAATSDNVAFSWDSSGPKTVSVSVTGPINTVGDSKNILSAPTDIIYLPVVLKQ